MRTKPDVVQTDATCNDALSMIDELDRRALPVVDGTGKLAGMITIFGLGAYFTPQINNPLDMRRVRSRISDIIRCLKARVVNVREEHEESELFIRVGAMDIRSFDRSAQEKLVPAKSSIVVVGDRWDIQEKCIQLGVRLIVITGGLAVDKDIEERVKEHGISLIVSPHDTATTSWIIRTATTVDHLMEPVKYRFSEDDTVASVKRRILEMNAPLFSVTDDEGMLLGVFSKTDLLRPITTQLVLVDHNEMSQAVDGAREVQITEIIDHHRLGNFSTEQPILFINEPVGSTCTIVSNLFRRNRLPISKSTAGILMAGLISDTLHLNSPTTTDIDREILKWLEEQSDVSSTDLAELIFRSGSTLSSQTPEEVIAADCKHYHHGEIEFSVSQIEELGFDPFWERWETLYQALDHYRSQHQLFFSTLLITDINKQNSLLLISGDSLTIESISYPHVEKNEIFELKGVVSRKKQLIPYLTSCLKGIGIAARE
jgi:manganese-dependent inorganic pyrophosphatase